MKVLYAVMTIFALSISSSWSAVSLATLPLKKTKKKNIPERQLGGNVEAQMDAEDASKKKNYF